LRETMMMMMMMMMIMTMHVNSVRIYSVIQKDGLKFIRLYFLNYT